MFVVLVLIFNLGHHTKAQGSSLSKFWDIFVCGWLFLVVGLGFFLRGLFRFCGFVLSFQNCAEASFKITVIILS